MNFATFSAAAGKENEAAWLLQPHPENAHAFLLALADGQGGSPHGGPAVRLACSQVMAQAVTLPLALLRQSATWQSLTQQADVAVYRDPGAGYSTLVAMLVEPSGMVGASNGDSAAVVQVGSKWITLTSRQAKNPPIGSGFAASYPFTLQLTESSNVLVMSDGVWKYVGWQRLQELWSAWVATFPPTDKRAEPNENLHSFLQQLAQVARLPQSGLFPDDFTVILISTSIT